jgi:hypothetical protein
VNGCGEQKIRGKITKIEIRRQVRRRRIGRGQFAIVPRDLLKHLAALLMKVLIARNEFYKHQRLTLSIQVLDAARAVAIVKVRGLGFIILQLAPCSLTFSYYGTSE